MLVVTVQLVQIARIVWMLSDVAVALVGIICMQMRALKRVLLRLLLPIQPLRLVPHVHQLA